MTIKFRHILLAVLSIRIASCAQSPDIQYLYPKDRATWIVKESPIIIRIKDIWPEQIQNFDSFIQVSGERSGAVPGKTVISTDERTIIFYPERPFQPGENVSVLIIPSIETGSFCLDTTISFTVSSAQSSIQKPMEQSEPDVLIREDPPKAYIPNEDGVVILNGVSVPSDFPYVDITINNNPDDGYIFINYEAEKYVNMILDNSGNPVFWWYVPDSRRDFKVQPTGVVTMTVRSGFEGGGYMAVDETYSVVDTFFVPDGFTIDEHELIIKPDGNYLVTAMTPRTIDMSQIVTGGFPNATVFDYHLIEMDADDNPVFIWLCTDPGNYEITDAEYVNLRASIIDYLHTNSIAVDLDGHYLITPKQLNEITKINRHTGEIMWRLGGKNNQFEYVDMDDFVFRQHCIRVLPNGNYTIFDNGTYHDPPYSRALEFRVDTTNMTVTKIWEFRDAPDKYSPYKGNVQRLPNGNTLINWGMEYHPKLTEVRPDGTKAFEMNFENPIQCYRVWRCPWEANAFAPFLHVENFTDRVTLLFNKFGDPDVAEYRIYGGPSSEPSTVMHVTNNPYLILDENDFTESQTYFFRVTAVDSYGNESAFSNEERVRTDFIPVNRNMVLNHDFDSGIGGWNFIVQGSASASVNTDNSECLFEIQQGGSSPNDVRLTQGNLTLYNGQTYSFEFDAGADQGRSIEARIESASPPYTNYGQTGTTFIQPSSQRFIYTFEMEHGTTDHARITFNVGGNNSDVTIDDVVFKRLDPSAVEKPAKQTNPNRCVLHPAYPNPFNPATTVCFTLPRDGDIQLTLFDSLGRTVQTLAEGPYSAGLHSVPFNGSHLSSGVYVCVLKAASSRRIRKLMLLK